MTKSRKSNGVAGVVEAQTNGGDWAASSSLIFSAQSCVRQVLIDISNAYRSGRTQQFEAIGIEKNQIAKATGLSSEEVEDLALNYARSAVARAGSSGVLNYDFCEIVELATKRVEEESLARGFIEAGASNKLMENLFGKRSTDCAAMRNRLNISNCRGRKAEPKDERIWSEIHSLYRQAMKSVKCKRTALLHIHQETGHPIDFIVRVVTDNGEFPL